MIKVVIIEILECKLNGDINLVLFIIANIFNGAKPIVGPQRTNERINEYKKIYLE